MTLINSDETSEETAKNIAEVPSRIVVSLASFIFCGFSNLISLSIFKGYISLLEIFFTLFFPAIIGVIATVYAFRTLIAKKNSNYQDAISYSQLAKIWTMTAFIFGIFWSSLSWFGQFI